MFSRKRGKGQKKQQNIISNHITFFSFTVNSLCLVLEGLISGMIFSNTHHVIDIYQGVYQERTSPGIVFLDTLIRERISWYTWQYYLTVLLVPVPGALPRDSIPWYTPWGEYFSIYSLWRLFSFTFNYRDISRRSLTLCNSVVGLTALGWPHIYLPALIFSQKHSAAAAAAALIFRQNRTCWVLHLVFNSFTPSYLLVDSVLNEQFN